MNLGDDLHTGQQAEDLVVTFQMLVFKFDMRFVVGGDGQASFLIDFFGSAADGIRGICAEVGDFAFVAMGVINVRRSMSAFYH